MFGEQNLHLGSIGAGRNVQGHFSAWAASGRLVVGEVALSVVLLIGLA